MNETTIDIMNLATPIALEGFENLYKGNLKFKEITPFTLEVPCREKRYAAKATAIVEYKGKNADKITIVAFEPGDATGDRTERYNENTLLIPDSVRTPLSFGPQRKLIPRSKDDILIEGCFPMFSITKDHVPHYHIISLEELTLNGINSMPEVKRAYMHGVESKDFPLITQTRERIDPVITVTANNMIGQEFANPHAMRNNAYHPAIVQITGFYAIKAGNPLNLPIEDIVNIWQMPTPARQ